MDKNSIKKYAIFARRELIERVSTRAQRYGITDKAPYDLDAVMRADGAVMTDIEKTQRQALIRRIGAVGFEQAMEEAAYTWFNRFCALRFMEVNGYLPSRIRVFTDENNAFKPQILAEALELGDKFDDIDMTYVIELKEANETGTLYKYLLITQCNALKTQLPGLFTKLDDYTELLIPDHLLREGSAIEQMIAMIPEDDWKDQVQIIGWLYQFYNIEQNELVYDGSMSKTRIPKELLPAATTIYTPDWAVRYMVENSLGRLAVEAGMNPAQDGIRDWRYYLEEADQDPEVETQLAEIRKQYAGMKPEDIKCIDPCMGSGHILVYMFDVLIQIYEAAGYNAREAASLILENNLHGLDIDDRAAQLAYFAVMMKARQYDRRILTRGIQPHVYAIAESNDINLFSVEFFCQNDAKLKSVLDTILSELTDAKEYGSILNVTPQDWTALYARYDEIDAANKNYVEPLLPLIQTAEALSMQYDVVVTNPPYLGNSRFSTKLDAYVKKNYVDVKADLSMVMYKHAIDSLCKKDGFIAFITTSSWMFLSSFEKLRIYQQEMTSISSLVDYGTELFEGKVGHNPIVSWVVRNTPIDTKMTAVRLVDYCYSNRDQKEPEFFESRNRHTAKQSNFSKIPGSPVAYWVGEAVYKAFENGKLLGDYFLLLAGTSTGDNSLYLREWFEVELNSISRNAPVNLDKRWYPCNTGGEFRKYSLNTTTVIDWGNNGYRIKNHINSKGKIGSAVRNKSYHFKHGITWNKLSSSNFGVRYVPDGYISDDTARMIMVDDDQLMSVLGYLCSNVCKFYLELLSPTLSFTNSELQRIPLKSELINIKTAELASQNVALSRADWDAFETSWDFEKHPLL